MGHKTALVFAGGGSLGAVQVGMVKALVACGLEVDLLVGASVGALNAAYLADRGLEAIGELESVWRRVRRSDIFPISVLHAVLGLFSMRESLVSPDALRSLLERELGARSFSDAQIPLFVVATDMEHGAEVTLSRGPLVPALMASAAIPAVFPAVEIEGRPLIDGGVANNTPISTAVGLGATRVIIAPTGSPCSCNQLPRTAIFAAVHALNISIARQLAIDVARFDGEAELSVVPPLCPLSAAAYTFSATDDLIARAEARTRRWIEGGGLGAREIGRVTLPHGPGCPCDMPGSSP